MSDTAKPLYARLAEVSMNRARKSVWADFDTQNPSSNSEPVSDQIPESKQEPVSIQQPGIYLATGTPSEIEGAPLRKIPVSDQTPVSNPEGAYILPNNAPHLRFPYEVLDKIFNQLKPGPRVILERLYRLSAGFDRDTCRISIPKLSSTCKTGLTQTRQYLKELESMGYITRMGDDVANCNIGARGVDFRVNLPRMQPAKRRSLIELETGLQTDTGSEYEPNKDKELKEQTHKHSSAPQTPKSVEGVLDINDQASRVSVRSRFTFANCKSYADHLHKTGQGILNAGGYATTIHRSGEADELIAAFLQPAAAPAKADHSKCPRCYGSGMEVVEGKGARRCTYFN